jgi:AcrR family transcriptional regulator
MAVSRSDFSIQIPTVFGNHWYVNRLLAILRGMPRPTRAERQAATRADILEAARKRFLDNGYAATSLDDIADDAGYSKGAVYSNFRDKPTLCRAVLESVHAEKLGEITAIASSHDGLDDQLAEMETWLERTIGDVGWTMLELEFAMLSRRDKDLTPMITDLHAGMQATVEAALASVAERVGSTDDPPISVSALAGIILATAVGLGVQRSVNPHASIDPAINALRAAAAVLVPGRDFRPAGSEKAG